MSDPPGAAGGGGVRRFTVLEGDVMDVLPGLEGFDACLCDPPYGLEFMGKEWDHGVPSEAMWRLVFDSLKPGAPLMAFGGTRTYHRLAVAIEDAGFEIRDTLCWLYGSGFPKSHDISKGIDKAAGAEGAWIEHPLYADRNGAGVASIYGQADGMTGKRHLYAPATPEAARWSGYGTALKPAWESIVYASRRPALTALCGTLAHRIKEALCQLPSSARDAGLSSESSRLVYGEAPDSALWTAVEECSTPGALFALMATLPSGSETPSSLSIASSWLATLAGILRLESTFTTATASELTTELQTLNCSPLAITPASIIEAVTGLHGIGSSASLAVATFTAARSRLDYTLTLSAHGPVTSTGDGEGLRPDFEPITLAMKPLDGTFAANALAHGVAGLNVDGGRIGTGVETWPVSRSYASGRMALSGRVHGEAETQSTGAAPQGRWPANVLLDPEAAEALDRASGESRDGVAVNRNRPESGSTYKASGYHIGMRKSADVTFGSAGGASRFFYTAKVSPSERGDSTHPTLKPVDLTAYLARLLLPPERDTPRRLLVPFSGDGSEMMGALRAGWDEVVGIEQNAESVASARQRIRGDAPLLNQELP